MLHQLKLLLYQLDQTKKTKAVNLIKKKLSKNFRVLVDDSDKSPGWKFSEHEMKGVPLRIEIGPRDLENGTVQATFRHNYEKTTVEIK